ncbi:MAG: hypothetical protein ABSG79_21190 [Bryobacteraceae bacterium]|jgi:hypothetical protein
MRRPVSLLFLAVFLLPAQDLPPEVLTLARIRDRVREAVERLPDCTCVETVARFRKPSGKQLKPLDRAVLQILFSGGKELFAFPGDSHWETSPFAFVTSGMMSSGLFALHLRAIFLDSRPIIKYQGDESPTGRREARYDFHISRMASGYKIQHAAASGVVAMRGSFWADPETYDLRRLEFHADEIPPELPYADISTAIYYNRVRIGERDVLLPQTADVRTTELNGEENRDLIEFTHCQGFHAESTLVFGAPRDTAASQSPAATSPQPAAAEATLPPDLGITVALSAPVDDRATVGSLIQGKVAGSVMQKGTVLVPEGALVEGRIRRLERYSDAGDYFIVALEFTRLETPGGNLRFYADLQDVDRREGAEMVLTNVTRLQPGGFQSAGRRAGTVTLDNPYSQRIWTHQIPGVGTFFVRGSSFSLPSGFKTVWKTQLYPLQSPPVR